MSLIEIKQINPKDAENLIRELDEYQSKLYPPESCHLDSIETLQQDNVKFLGAVESTQIIAIGSVKILKGYGEIKRVYVPPLHRGKGLAKQILVNLESILVENEVYISRLETGPYSQDAIGLYKKLGYAECGAFGDYHDDPLSTFMEKKLSR
ncbi:GNAT family N-acetyltransferase [Aliikangiella coralliicola]|uniref:GNAT family N-acetyltransferase n=1 Tax=Aliikangiella coralliicola TaxID=2592383 RepID=A0A545UJK1_9GAMM|nr:GNAT family N-acetyltransferase [Aliikangiella coralliicola]TQV89641.1 GNAT family N-acetyltransferase [Aliikangiella coralliicola]